MLVTFVPLISVVSPVYQAERVLDELVTRLEAELASLDGASWEIILVDDGSTDESWQVICRHAARIPQVRGLRLSRNFGQHHAITAGLDQCKGQWVIVLDCDLQDQPEEISRLWQKAQEGYEAVLARRGQRTDSPVTIWGARLFYRTLEYLTGQSQDPDVGNFGVYHRRLIDTVLRLRESTRYFPTMVRWAGFRQTSLPVAHGQSARPTSYSLGRRLQLALDILLTYSDKPLRLTVYFGLLLAGAAFGLGLWMLLRALRGQIIVLGYASLIVSLCFFSGVLITVLGIVGLYVGKTFECVRARPLYVVSEHTT
ncbi:dolichol-phosphate mannosyltransferase [Hymenobacter gelipurpurascens]|uniref:Dolichol-phosphate mannosyltransferase n=1 Tax=Hymenobacter gelipurpurascens TaxID=89968 RepID=A0A212TPF3_9BACT|nr:glycosyltransferase family 2 protein [Hymenobacter gelipurpurascens]SNC67701.1 dolichol-phosphate mannosyltransferase [Hymenobacter gelipurpurascens]